MPLAVHADALGAVQVSGSVPLAADALHERAGGVEHLDAKVERVGDVQPPLPIDRQVRREVELAVFHAAFADGADEAAVGGGVAEHLVFLRVRDIQLPPLAIDGEAGRILQLALVADRNRQLPVGRVAEDALQRRVGDKRGAAIVDGDAHRLRNLAGAVLADEPDRSCLGIEDEHTTCRRVGDEHPAVPRGGHAVRLHEAIDVLLLVGTEQHRFPTAVLLLEVVDAVVGRHEPDAGRIRRERPHQCRCGGRGCLLLVGCPDAHVGRGQNQSRHERHGWDVARIHIVSTLPQNVWHRTHSELTPVAPKRNSFAPIEPCGLWQLAHRSVRPCSLGSGRPPTGCPIVGWPDSSDGSRRILGPVLARRSRSAGGCLPKRP